MRYTVIGLALLLLGSGCASYEPTATAMPSPTVQQEDWHVQNGMAVAAYPIVEEPQQQQMFDANLNDTGVIPIQVVIENRTERVKWVRPVDMVMTLPDKRTFGPTAVDSVAARVDEDGSIAGSYLAFGIIGYVVASNAENSAKQARTADYEAKSLRSSKLSQDQSSHGFVFFIPPPGTGELDEATLSVFFVDDQEAASERIDVPLTGLKFKPIEVRKKEIPEYPE